MHILALLLAGLASMSEASMAEEAAELTTFCRGYAPRPWRHQIKRNTEHCDDNWWNHGFTFYAFSTEQHETSQYCVGTAAHRFGWTYRLKQGSYCGGRGWTHRFTFFAYDHPKEGTEKYCVGWARRPWRASLSKKSSCRGRGWTHSFNLYMYSDPGDRVTMTRQVLRSITYPDLDEMPPLAPSQIFQIKHCNSHSTEREFAAMVATETISTGTRSCFHWDVSTTGGISATHSATVSGGVPGIGDAEASASATVSWEIAAAAGRENCRDNTAEKTMEFAYPVVSLPPRTAHAYTFTQFQGRLSSVRFEAVLEQTWSNNEKTNTAITGTYEGVSYSGIVETFHDEEDVDDCVGWEGHTRRLDAENEPTILVDVQESESAISV